MRQAAECILQAAVPHQGVRRNALCPNGHDLEKRSDNRLARM